MTKRPRHKPLASSAVNIRAIAATAAGIVLFLAATLGGLGLVFRGTVPREAAAPPENFPQPQLQTAPADDLRSQLATQNARLTGYRWANADHTEVAIPITRAMELIAQRGERAYDPLQLPPVPGGKP